jgi:tellurite resistance protein
MMENDALRDPRRGAAGALAKVLPAAAIDDAVLDTIVIAACADGVTKDELDAIGRMARELPSLKRLTEQEVTTRLEGSYQRIHTDGLEGRLKAIASSPLDQGAKRQIFQAAAVMQYADGKVSAQENAFLEDLASALALDASTVIELLDEVEEALASA